MTDIRRSVVKRLIKRTQGPQLAVRLAESAIHAAGYEIFEIRELNSFPVQCLPPIYPASRSEVARPKLIGESQEVFFTNLPPVEPMIFKNIQGQSGSSIFRRDQMALVGQEIYNLIDRVSINNQYENCIVEGGSVALKRSNVGKIKKGICAFGQGSSNWYHWVAEYLPTVLLSQNLPSAYDGYPLLVPEAAVRIPSFKEALDLCRDGRDILPMKEAQIYEFNEMVYIPPQVSGPFNLLTEKWPEPGDYIQNIDLLLELRNAILKKLAIRSEYDGPTKVFLARPPGRRSYNQEEIMAAAKRRGFTLVWLEKLSLKEQVQLIHNADYVVGPTGAAFTNVLFMKPGSKSLIWTLEQYAGACFFSNLAHLAKVDLIHVFVEADNPLMDSSQAFAASYQLPVEDFCRHIDALLEM
jgi:hypothetical protein